MSKVKKVFAIILSMAMILGMSLTAFAAETTNVVVTVENDDVAALYYDQIVLPDTTSTDGWKYDDSYARFFTDISISDLVAIVKDGDAETGTLTSSEALAGALESLKSTVQTDDNLISADPDDDSYKFTATSGGLYVVLPVKEGYTYSPTLVYVPVNSTDSISVKTKGGPNQIQKTVAPEGETVSAGDVIQYTVTVEYPYISANYTDATFKISDTLTNGTFVIDDTHLVGVTGIDAGTYTVSEANDTNNIEINVTNYDRAKSGSTVTITYWVRVSETVSSTSPLQNKVSSELTLTPGGTPIKTEYIVISTPVKAEIDKVNTEGTKLNGAVFAIYEGSATDQLADKLVSIVADAADITGISLPSDYSQYTNLLKADGTENGTTVFDGLDAQKDYYIVEIIAPNGYSVDRTPHQLIKGTKIDTEPTKSTVNGVTTITTEHKYTDFKVTADNNNVVNDTLSSLPETGGIGTTIFTVGGCVIMIAAAGLFFASRRKESK